jgi:hypothetical protein
MGPAKASTLITVIIVFLAVMALLKWVILPIMEAADPTGTACMVVNVAVPPATLVWGVYMLFRDSKRAGEEEEKSE